jgi:hypothetical protein
LLYGEGNQAFMRLQLEIMKISDDESLFAWANENSYFGESGLLANAPAAFKLSQHIRNSFPENNEPYLMTNKGIQITLPLCRIELSKDRLYPPALGGSITHYLARLNCHSKYTGEAVVVKLRATIGHGREWYGRLDSNRLDFDLRNGTPGSPVNTRYKNRQIFVYQYRQVPPTNPKAFSVEVHLGPLLDHGLLIRTGVVRSSGKPELGEAIYARKWMFHLNLDLGPRQSIVVKGCSAAFALIVSSLFLPEVGPYLTIELLSDENDEVLFGRPLQIFALRRDRATMKLFPSGDSVSASLKKVGHLKMAKT